MELILALALAAAAVFALVLWSRTRRRTVHFDVPPGDVHSLMHSIAALTWGSVVEGNAVRIVQDSEFFDVLFDEIEHASHHVHLETFLWEDGSVSDRVVEALTAAARRGIELRVLVDHRGAKTTSPAVWATLRESGVDFRVYHRARLREIGFYNNRDHRKIAVIDGHVGFTFGHGIADTWAGRREGWRDTAARFEGPVVRELQAAFLENWTKVTRRALSGRSTSRASSARARSRCTWPGPRRRKRRARCSGCIPSPSPRRSARSFCRIRTSSRIGTRCVCIPTRRGAA